MSQVATEAPQAVNANSSPDVLTLAEAAEYLRVDESDVLDLATRHELPARKIGSQWRFHRQAIIVWLCAPEQQDFWKSHFGALKDDPYMEEMLQKIYQERGGTTTPGRSISLPALT